MLGDLLACSMLRWLTNLPMQFLRGPSRKRRARLTSNPRSSFRIADADRVSIRTSNTGHSGVLWGPTLELKTVSTVLRTDGGILVKLCESMAVHADTCRKLRAHLELMMA